MPNSSNSSDNVPNAPRTIRIATRASKLALWQAEFIAAEIKNASPNTAVEIVHISTIGDRDRSVPLWEMGGQGVFTREVQKALFDQRADIAVHSLKDLPTETQAGLALAGIPERGQVEDALVLPKSKAALAITLNKTTTALDALPSQARIGTSSLRRQAQLKFHRNDLEMVDIRGNVETRLEKLDAGEYDAIVLACAGLERLGFGDRISQKLAPPIVFPAVGQGCLGIECRSDDANVIEILHQISHPQTRDAVFAERALLRTLQAGCHAPVGAATWWENNQLHMKGVVLDAQGTVQLAATNVHNDCPKQNTQNQNTQNQNTQNQNTQSHTEELGIRIANDLLAQGAQPLIEATA